MRYLLIALMSVAFLVACGNKVDHQAMNHAEHDMGKMEMAKAEKVDTEKRIYYTCPMDEHKHVHSREAGKCPECSMDLVEGVLTTEDQMEYWGCPMLTHSHVRETESGRCDECKMMLKPMRLKKGAVQS